LLKSNFDDIQESLNIFKLILRSINVKEYDQKRDKALIDFIIQKAIDNPKLKDEILVQIINQTLRSNESSEKTSSKESDSNKKAWLLLSYCLSSFLPSNILYKYLLK
jgi:hypothetical protein